MLRYFVAIPLPDDARECLIAAQPDAIPGMRLIGREELHLTLHFLGELAAQSVEAAQVALANLELSAFTITIKGLGRFTTKDQSIVLWSGVEDSPSLAALHRTIGTVLTNAIGYQPEQRPYLAHITLARLNDPPGLDAVKNYLEQQNQPHIPAVRIKRFGLYSSEFVNDVPQYREVALFRLCETDD